MTLEEVKEVCKELKLICKRHSGTDWYIYTPNCSFWLACYYQLFAYAVIYHSGEPFINDKDEFKEGLLRKLKEIKEKSIKYRIKSLGKDFV